MEIKTKNSFVKRRLFVYISGLFIIAFGSNFFVNAALGVAPFSSIAYALTFIFPLSFSVTTLCMNSFHLFLECCLLKTFSLSYLMQLVMTILYSFFLQILSGITGMFHAETFLQQLFMAIIACLLMAVGMTLMILSNFVVLPSEGFVGALAFRFHKDFGNIKTYADIAEVIIAFLIAFVFAHTIAIGIGTLLSAFFTGAINKLFLKLFRTKLLAFMGE